MPTHTHATTLLAEFDRQAENLLANGYHLEGQAALRDIAGALPPGAGDRVPFVIVVPGAAPDAMALVDLNGKTGYTEMTPTELATFVPIDGVVPPGRAYLAVDIDLGADSLNVTPDDALPGIVARRRSPLTIDEGVAVLLHVPHVLATHNAFSLLGSRCGDRRVTALWLSKRRPRLGWCWAGNPHTWLGSASCARRVP